MRSRMLITGMLLLALVGLGGSLLSGGTQAANPGAGGGTVAPPRPEVLVVRLSFRDAAERDRLATEFSAEEIGTAGGYLTVLTDRQGYAGMLRRGLRAAIDVAQTQQANNPHLFGSGGPDTFYGGYKTVEEESGFLDQYVAAYPTLAEKIDLGPGWCVTHSGCTLTNPSLTWPGYHQYALHITNQSIPGPKPVYWYEAGIHAREIAVPEIAMRYIQWLLDGYNSDPDAHWLVDYHDIWVLPMVNPDGHHMDEYGGSPGSIGQRKNANYTNGCTTWGNSFSQLGTDNNRNFPFMWNCCGGSSSSACDQTYHGTGGGSDPETQNVVNQIRLLVPDQRGPNITDPAPITTTGVFQDMHSAAELDLYSWGMYSTAAPNGPELGNFAQHMSAANAYPPGNSYQACQPPLCLYAVDGDAFDWAYGELGMAGVSTEIGPSGDFYPSYSLVDSSIWPQNRGALIYEAKMARMPYLLAHGPDAAGVATLPMTVTQGTPAVISGTINFAWAGNAFSQNAGAAEYYVDTPPWAGGTAIPMSGNFGVSPTTLASATIDTSSLSVGRHLLFVRGRGVNQFQGYDTWGPISAAWLWVTPGGGATATPTPPPTSTSVPPTATRTAAPSATRTPLLPSATPTLVPPSATAVPASSTPVPGTATSGPAPSATPVPGTPTLAAATSTPGASATPCTVSFSDVHPTDYFYVPVQYLACHGVISGYADGTFRPYNTTTRGQMVKIVVLGFNKPLVTPASGGHTFADVPPGAPFFDVIETAAADNIISGYTCGGPGEPCDLLARPYFRPNAYVTRAQLAKIVVVGAGWLLQHPTIRTFADVPANDPFYPYVETAYCHGVISGYNCGGPGEPCDNLNRPYFRPNQNATRGQIAKIVYIAVTGPNTCPTVK